MSESAGWSLNERFFRSLAIAVIAVCLIAFFAGGPVIGGVPLILAAVALAIPYFAWAAWRLWTSRHGGAPELGLDLMLVGWTTSVVAIVSTVLLS